MILRLIRVVATTLALVTGQAFAQSPSPAPIDQLIPWLQIPSTELQGISRLQTSNPRFAASGFPVKVLNDLV